MQKTKEEGLQEEIIPLQEKVEKKAKFPLWKRIFFSNFFLNATLAKKVAFTGVLGALAIVVNVVEIKFADVQFSLTMFVALLSGILLGALPAALAILVGDSVGYLVNSMGYPYYWWVMLSLVVMAMIAGLIMKIPLCFKGSVYLKLAFLCLLTLVVCSVGINSTGMYYIGLDLYTSPAIKEALEANFGGEKSFFAYLIIRFFILGQIYNSILNYALLFVVLPTLSLIKPFKLNLREL